MAKSQNPGTLVHPKKLVNGYSDIHSSRYGVIGFDPFHIFMRFYICTYVYATVDYQPETGQLDNASTQTSSCSVAPCHTAR
jgi:hypothetical protein